MNAPTEKPALQVIYRPVAELIPYARNARTHSEKQVTQIASSIREFGFNNPVLIDEHGGIIAGHGRVMAAKQLALTEVPCVVLKHLTDAQKKAYVLADNKLALNSGWDWEMLGIELNDLASSGDFDMGLTGFSAKDIKELTGAESAAPVLGNDLKYKVIVDCKDEAHQIEMLKRFESEGLACRPLMI